MEAARHLLSTEDEHPHLVLCGVDSELKLRNLLRRLERHKIAFRAFWEPDIDGQLTALATQSLRGDQRLPLRRYQCLRGRESYG